MVPFIKGEREGAHMSDNDSKAKNNPEVSNAPEPIKPIRGSSYRRPSSLMARRVDTAPDWNYWRQMPHAELWKAVALSSNLDPRKSELGYQVSESVRGESRYDDEEYKQAFEWLEIASARVEELEVVLFATNIYYTVVKLPQFAALADSLGWPIPEDFKSMAKAAETMAHASIADKPYSNPTLEILNAAIKEFFNPRRSPDAKKEEIVEWVKARMAAEKKPKSDNIAKAIFTIIKPIDHDPRKRRG